jgi:hypothetical protein
MGLRANILKEQWYQTLIDPMAEALNDQDALRFAQAREQACEASCSGAYDVDTGNAIMLLVAYHDFLCCVAFRELDKAIEAYPRVRCMLLADTIGPESDLTRRRYYLQLRIVADNMDIEQLPLDEFRSHFSALQFLEVHTEQWYFASNFAFRHQDLETISQAYEQFLLYRDEKDNEKFQWIRLSVMYRLLRQEARRVDIEHLFLSIRTAANAREVESLLLPVIESQGLMSSDLEDLLADTIGQIDKAD